MKQGIESLINEHIGLVEQFAKSKGLQSRNVKKYSNKEENSYRVVSCVIEYEQFKVRFAYEINEGMLFKKGIITAYFNIKDYEYHICDLLAKVAPKDKDCVVFPYVDSEEVLNSCLKQLFQKLNKYESLINDLASNSEKRRDLESNVKQEIMFFSGRPASKKGPLSLAMFGIYAQSALIRYTSEPYIAYLNGNYKKALKLYAKESSLTLYERQLVKRMKFWIKRDIKREIPEEQKTINIINVVKKEVKVYSILTFIMLLPFSFVVLEILYKVLLYIVQSNAIVMLHLSCMYLIIPSMLLSWVTCAFARDKLFLKKMKSTFKLKNLYHTFELKRQKFDTLKVCISTCIIIVAFLASLSFQVREDGIKFAQNVFDIKGTMASYKEIKSYDKDSKQILLENGEKIDLNIFSGDFEKINNLIMK